MSPTAGSVVTANGHESPNRPLSFKDSTGYHVVDSGDHRLLQSDIQLGENRHQRWPESVKVRLGLPDVEDLDLTVRFERAVIRAPLRLACTGSFQLLDCTVVLLRREAFVYEI